MFEKTSTLWFDVRWSRIGLHITRWESVCHRNLEKWSFNGSWKQRIGRLAWFATYRIIDRYNRAGRLERTIWRALKARSRLVMVAVERWLCVWNIYVCVIVTSKSWTFVFRAMENLFSSWEIPWPLSIPSVLNGTQTGIPPNLRCSHFFCEIGDDAMMMRVYDDSSFHSCSFNLRTVIAQAMLINIFFHR